MSIASAIAILLSLIGEPALVAGSAAGACHGEVISVGVVVFGSADAPCSLDSFHPGSEVYLGADGEEPLDSWAVRPAGHGRVVLTFRAEAVQ